MTGCQQPRVASFPDVAASRGDEAIEIAARCGLELDEWQQLVLRRSLGVREDGKWAAFEVGLNVPRQNGKGGVLEAMELAGLFCFGERLIIHSAHEFPTANEAFGRMEALLEEGGLVGELKPRSGVSRSHGDEGFKLRSGARLRYRTRTKGGGRGFSCDRLILDEAMVISEAMHGALLPTLSARPNSQVVYTGSAVDQFIHPDGVVFARVRERGVKGDGKSLAYFEWSAPTDETPDKLSEEQLVQEGWWAAANPGLGIRISAEHVGLELESMAWSTFATERLGIGDWPPTSRMGASVIDLDTWMGLVDVKSEMLDPVVFAFDVAPNRKSAAIAAASRRADGRAHMEVVDYRRNKGPSWVIDRLVELVGRHEPLAVVCAGKSPASALVDQADQEGLQVEVLSLEDNADACATVFDLVTEGKLRHLNQPELKAAVQGARQKTYGDAWVWSRSKSNVDISPLVAGTLAVGHVWNQDAVAYGSDRGLVVL